MSCLMQATKHSLSSALRQYIHRYQTAAVACTQHVSEENNYARVGIAAKHTLKGAMAEHAAPELPKRCHHCAGPLSKDMETSSWTVTPLVRDSFSMIGSAVGGTAGAFYAFNHAMPVVRRYIKGPMWIHFLVGAPPVVVFSSACAGLAAGTIPAVAQLVSSSCHAAMSSPSFARPASHDDMHKSRGSSPL